MNRFLYFIVLSISISFLFSDYKGVSGKEPFSFQKKRDKGIIKGGNNQNLKIDLLELEENFKVDYEEIKINYREKISSLKEIQKSEVKTLKQNYRERRKAIYKKYGVKPPKKNEGDSMDNSHIFKPNKKDKRLKSIKKSKK